MNTRHQQALAASVLTSVLVFVSGSTVWRMFIFNCRTLRFSVSESRSITPIFTTTDSNLSSCFAI